MSTHPTLPSSPFGKGDSSKNTFEVQKFFLRICAMQTINFLQGIFTERTASFPVSRGNCSSLPNVGDAECYSLA